ncbi:restriction endonuclease subunit S [Paenibacillus illinoisensis]|uniref:restriction endonuclease subunit S n=1 Tax=Paenibacillus illinoisensis TaxID=59845 RepID=UPI003A4D46FE
MLYKKIKELCEIKKGKKVVELEESFEDSKRYIQIDDLRNNNQVKYCSPDSNYVYVNKNDLIIAWDGANAGTVGFDLEGAIGSTLAKISVISKNVFAPFLALYLQSKFDYFQRTATGATIPHISRTALEDLEVPIFTMEQQKYIFDQLMRTKKLIEKRQSQITALDKLTKSLFLEMFGNPIQNIKKFKQMPIKNVVSDIQTGWSPVASKEPANNNEPGVLKLSAVTGGRYNFKENKKLLDGTPFKSEYEVNVGDVLLTRKNTKELVGACSYIFETPSQLMFSDLIFKLIIKNTTLIEPIYLWRLLNNNSMKKELSKLASGSSGSMPNISKKNLSELLVVVPPIELQKEFVDKIISLEKLRNDFIDSLSSYEKLYNSLIHKAFKGEFFQEQ